MASAQDKLTKADAEEYLRRFPAQGFAIVAFNFAMVLIGNGLILWLLMSGRMQGAHLIALVLLETVLLVAIANASQLGVPQADRLDPPKPLKERLGLLAFLLVWLAFAYGVTLLLLEQWRVFAGLFVSTQAWIDAGLHWPLGWTLALALLHAIGDRIHYATRGGRYFSTVSHDAMARMLTLIFGGIPFAMPFFVVTIGGFKTIEYIARKAKVDPKRSALVASGALAVAVVGFVAVGELIDNEVHGWAIGYVLAKAISELVIAAIPLVMAEAAKGK